jgi:hypothetical protein
MRGLERPAANPCPRTLEPTGRNRMLMAAETHWMSKVFTVYTAFWVTVLIVLYVAVGVLLRKRARHDDSHSGPGAHH